MIIPQDWPQVLPNEHGKRKLFVMENLGDEDLAILQQKGWKVVDVRLMPQGDATERKAALEAKLEGINLGSIKANKTELDAIELEARVLKMLNQKESPLDNKPKELPQEAHEVLSSIGSNRAGLDLGSIAEKIKKRKK